MLSGKGEKLEANVRVCDAEKCYLLRMGKHSKVTVKKVTWGRGGVRGTRFFAHDPADVLVTDIFMPDYDGIQFIGYFRKFYPHVPIIAISGNPIGDMLEVARKLGVAAALEKPFAVEDLLKAVDEVLKK